MELKLSWERKWPCWPINQSAKGRCFIPEKAKLNGRGELLPKATAAGNQASWRNRSKFSGSLGSSFTHTPRSCEWVGRPLRPPLGTVVRTLRQRADCQWVTLGHVTSPRTAMCVGETTTRPRPHFLESGSKVDGWVVRRRLFQCSATEGLRDQGRTGQEVLAC